MVNRAEIENIYALKGVCAYLIILLHCKFPGNMGIIFEVLARIAVPCFFMISGYFSYPYNKEKIKNRIISTWKLIVSVEIIYFLAAFDTCNLRELVLSRYCSPTALVKLFCFSVYGAFGAGWYLYAMIGIYILYEFTGGGTKDSVD